MERQGFISLFYFYVLEQHKFRHNHVVHWLQVQQKKTPDEYNKIIFRALKHLVDRSDFRDWQVVLMFGPKKT